MTTSPSSPPTDEGGGLWTRVAERLREVAAIVRSIKQESNPDPEAPWTPDRQTDS